MSSGHGKARYGAGARNMGTLNLRDVTVRGHRVRFGEERGITPVIWWQPTNPANPAQGLYGRHERTLAGKHDAYLIEWARATRAAGEATGKPILPPVRARSHGRVVPVVGRRLDNTKENDKAAWRHVWRSSSGRERCPGSASCGARSSPTSGRARVIE